MQIQSETVENPPSRSIFGNYDVAGSDFESVVNTPNADGQVLLVDQPLQRQIDGAMARCFVYRWLAAGFEYPSDETWDWFIAPETQCALQNCLANVQADPADPLWRSAVKLITQLRVDRLDEFVDHYLYAFGHAARGPCPINEIEYGDLKADPLFQPHRLADLSAFYRAFGLDLADDGAERQDHLSIELEFMSVLAGKEAFALEHQLDEEASLCHNGQRKFLREHLGRWLPACVWRLSKSEGILAALALFAGAFVAADCSQFGITPGSEDLLLRPVDEAGESLCASCGITNLPPGALTTT